MNFVNLKKMARRHTRNRGKLFIYFNFYLVVAERKKYPFFN